MTLPQSARPVPLAAAVFDMSRGRQALISVAQPILCALVAINALPALRIVLLGLVAATCGSLAVFALNDVFDRHVDAEALRAGKGPLDRYDIDFTCERHPLACGHVPFPLAIAWVSALLLVATVCSWLLSPLSMALFLVAAAFQAVYCALRRVTPLKTLVEGGMVGLGSLAGWAAVAPLRWAAVWPFLFLSAWEIGGRNMSNDMADLRCDSAVGVRTVAAVYGPRAASRVIFAVMLADVALALTLPVPWFGRALAVAGGIWAMLVPGIRLLRDPTPAQAADYFNHASLYPVIAMLAVLVSIAAGRPW